MLIFDSMHTNQSILFIVFVCLLLSGCAAPPPTNTPGGTTLPDDGPAPAAKICTTRHTVTLVLATGSYNLSNPTGYSTTGEYQDIPGPRSEAKVLVNATWPRTALSPGEMLVQLRDPDSREIHAFAAGASPLQIHWSTAAGIENLRLLAQPFNQTTQTTVLLEDTRIEMVLSYAAPC